MKRKLLSLILLLLCLAFVFSLASCGGGTSDGSSDGGSGNETVDTPPSGGTDAEKPDTGRRVRVTLVVGEGFTVEGSTNIEVAYGRDAEFKIKIEDGWGFKSASAGEYNAETGTLVIKGVTTRTTVNIELEKLDYDTSVTYAYVFRGTDKDTTSVAPSGSVKAGTLIKVTAGDRKRVFVGWTYGKSLTAGGTLASEEREFEFRLTPDIVTNNALFLFPNYIDSNVYYYDVNGGNISTAPTKNREANDYYEALVDGNRLKVTLLDKYYSYAECASTFWDDGTFFRTGYVLKEYNTSPDGTGEPYSLGSKFFTASVDNEYPTLYCIWEKAEDAESFSYSDVFVSNPASKAEYAPGWIENGIIINSYTGSAETLVIPEKIGDKAVIAIGEGAFVGESFKTLVLPKTIEKIEDGAFVNCASLETLYFPNSISEISDAIFDAATYEGFRHLIVNATMAPRDSHSTDGAFAVKFSRVLAAREEKKIIIISGSSTYQSHATEYMEALFGGEYTVINFGTTRPRPGMVYLEALAHYTDEDDVFVYAPENSAYMYGEKYLSWRMLRNLEGMNNLFRYFDISNYEGYFSSFGELNREHNYKSPERRYEDICINGNANSYTDKNGDYQNPNREVMGYDKYIDSYYITLNNRVKSMTEALWNDSAAQENDKDYNDPNNTTWISIDDPARVAQLNMAIGKAKASGAKVYFGFAPADADAVVSEARSDVWISAYDKLIDDLYDFDGRVGSAKTYIFNHAYFYDCAFHTNNYGRTYRTYLMYVDLCKILGIDEVRGIYDVGEDFDGCKFEDGSDGTPNLSVDWLP